KTRRFVDVNQTLCNWLGYTRDEMLQLTTNDIEVGYPLQTEVEWQNHIDEVKSSGTFLINQALHRRKDGSIYPVEALVTFQTFEGNDYFLLIFRDITEHNQFKERLHQSQRLEAVGQLAGGIAHNFNNMLTAIMGYVGLSIEAIPNDHKIVRDLQGIQKTAERAANLTHQLLAFTRNQVTQPELVDLNELVLHMNELLRQLISEAIDLETLPAPHLNKIKADVGQLEQVLVNLVVNARDAMPKGGKLTIETANVTFDETYTQQYSDVEPGQYVMLAVSDTGTGMNNEVRERAFEPFFTTKEVGQGTGLGLSTCFGIIKQNKGHITVYSEIGKGTTFKVYLPRLDDKEVTQRGKLSTGLLSKLGTETILLVEDEDTVREMAARVLTLQGYHVMTARHGEEALKVASKDPKQSIHLLITDVIMPTMGGTVLAKQLTEIYPNLAIIYISGYTDNAMANQGLLEPDINFVAKPFTPESLIYKVRQVLDNHKL
ncbi:MAG: ATP-binding protein, partial [Chloroflexota bacterium]